MRLLSKLVTSALALCGVAAAAGGLAKRASLQQVTNFGANSSGAKMYIYVPNNVAANPAIIVAIHYCSGTASAYYSGTPYATLAEKYGFIVIYPESPYSGTCWDVSSKEALTHNGGADSNSIVNMVSYTLSKYNGDKSRVFVTGTSSGAMMTVSFSSIPICYPYSSIGFGVCIFIFFDIFLELSLTFTRRTSWPLRTPTCSPQVSHTPACRPPASTLAQSTGGTAPVRKAS